MSPERLRFIRAQLGCIWDIHACICLYKICEGMCWCFAKTQPHYITSYVGLSPLSSVFGMKSSINLHNSSSGKRGLNCNCYSYIVLYLLLSTFFATWGRQKSHEAGKKKITTDRRTVSYYWLFWRCVSDCDWQNQYLY